MSGPYHGLTDQRLSHLVPSSHRFWLLHVQTLHTRLVHVQSYTDRKRIAKSCIISRSRGAVHRVPVDLS